MNITIKNAVNCYLETHQDNTPNSLSLYGPLGQIIYLYMVLNFRLGSVFSYVKRNKILTRFLSKVLPRLRSAKKRAPNSTTRMYCPMASTLSSKDHLVQHNKQYHSKVLLNSFHLNGHTSGCQQQSK